LHFPGITDDEHFSSSTDIDTVGSLAPYTYYQNTVNHSTKFSNKRKFTIILYNKLDFQEVGGGRGD
jgi:hypothetical protein